MNRTESSYPKPIITPDKRPTWQVVEDAVKGAKQGGDYISIVRSLVQEKPKDQRK